MLSFLNCFIACVEIYINIFHLCLSLLYSLIHLFMYSFNNLFSFLCFWTSRFLAKQKTPLGIPNWTTDSYRTHHFLTILHKHRPCFFRTCRVYKPWSARLVARYQAISISWSFKIHMANIFCGRWKEDTISWRTEMINKYKTMVDIVGSYGAWLMIQWYLTKVHHLENFTIYYSDSPSWMCWRHFGGYLTSLLVRPTQTNRRVVSKKGCLLATMRIPPRNM